MLAETLYQIEPKSKWQSKRYREQYKSLIFEIQKTIKMRNWFQENCAC